MLNPIESIIPHFTHQTLHAAGNASPLYPVHTSPSSTSFFCPECGGSEYLTAGYEHAVEMIPCALCQPIPYQFPWESDEEMLKDIFAGKAPELEGV